MGIQQLFDPNISRREKDKIAQNLLQFASGMPIKETRKPKKGVRKINSNPEVIFNLCFKEQILFSKIEDTNLPAGDYVYAFRLKGRKVQTVSGKSSHFLYFGHTNSLNRRMIREYFHGNGGKTTKRLHLLLVKKEYKNKVELIYAKARDKTEASHVEAWLRTLFYNEFDQLPVWNRQE